MTRAPQMLHAFDQVPVTVLVRSARRRRRASCVSISTFAKSLLGPRASYELRCNLPQRREVMAGAARGPLSVAQPFRG